LNGFFRNDGCGLLRIVYGLAQAPTITSVTNAAIPSIDLHLPTYLKPRSMGTIFGSGLAGTTVSTAPPWPSTGVKNVTVADNMVEAQLCGPPLVELLSASC
jgi:hypothetical protein